MGYPLKARHSARCEQDKEARHSAKCEQDNVLELTGRQETIPIGQHTLEFLQLCHEEGKRPGRGQKKTGCWRVSLKQKEVEEAMQGRGRPCGQRKLNSLRSNNSGHSDCRDPAQGEEAWTPAWPITAPHSPGPRSGPGTDTCSNQSQGWHFCCNDQKSVLHKKRQEALLMDHVLYWAPVDQAAN